MELAYESHRRSEYELSVPVILAQADGICQELIGIQLYQKRRNVPATATYVQSFATDTLFSALLYPLLVPLPLSAGQHERDDEFDMLNRHQVLHGESFDYGTKKNSLRAFSLIYYVASVLISNNHDMSKGSSEP